MRTYYSLITVFFVCVMIMGCGGGSQMAKTSAEPEIPVWYTELPQDSDYVFSANTAVSKDMQLAIEKAVAAARAEIRRQVEVKIENLQKRFDEEVGLGEDAQLLQQFTSATKIVVSTSISGSKIEKQIPKKEDTGFRAYVLVSYPSINSTKNLVEEIKKEELLYTRFRESQIFKELETEVEKMETRKEGEE